MVSSTTTALAELGNIAFGGGGQKFAVISVAADEDSAALVAALTKTVDAVVVAKGKIRVLAVVATQAANAGGSMYFESGSTALTGDMKAIATSNQIGMPFNPAGWFETDANEALNLTTAGTGVYGCLVYDEVAI